MPDEHQTRGRSELAALTPGERLFFYAWLALRLVVPIAGLILIGAGKSTRVIGFALLVLGVGFNFVPVVAVLRRRVSRREQGSEP